MDEKVQCIAVHTAYQPEDAKWRCPKCGKTETFWVEEKAEEACEECPKLHAKDECTCGECGWGGSGKKVAELLMDLDHQVVCPCCKGKGTIAEGQG